jgi:CheY-like chemotaxis protein
VTTSAEAVRRLLGDTPGEALCDACLAFACGTSLSDMRQVTARLLEDTSFGRLAACARCGRVVATIARLSSCVHCRQPIGPGEHPSRVGDDVLHTECQRILVADGTIRVSPDQAGPSPRASEHAQSRNVARLLVVVVDDDVSVRRGLGRLLSAAGYRVSTFASGRAFLDRRADDTPSCLVLDVRMPGLSGLAVHDVLRAAGERIPVVFITGDGEIPETTRASTAASVAILSKPVDDDQLFATVHRLIAASEDQSAST